MAGLPRAVLALREHGLSDPNLCRHLRSYKKIIPALGRSSRPRRHRDGR